MAQQLISDSGLRIVFDHGVDLDGNQIFKNKNYNNVKTDATPDALDATIQALVPLQQHPMVMAERYNTYQIVSI